MCDCCGCGPKKEVKKGKPAPKKARKGKAGKKAK